MRKLLFIGLFSAVSLYSLPKENECFKPIKIRHKKIITHYISDLENGIGLSNNFLNGLQAYYQYEKNGKDFIYWNYQLGISAINTKSIFNSNDNSQFEAGIFAQINPRIYVSKIYREKNSKPTLHYPGTFVGIKAAAWYYPALSGKELIYSFGPNIGYRAVFFQRFLAEGSIGAINTSLGNGSKEIDAKIRKSLIPEFSLHLVAFLY